MDIKIFLFELQPGFPPVPQINAAAFPFPAHLMATFLGQLTSGAVQMHPSGQLMQGSVPSTSGPMFGIPYSPFPPGMGAQVTQSFPNVAPSVIPTPVTTAQVPSVGTLPQPAPTIHPPVAQPISIPLQTSSLPTSAQQAPAVGAVSAGASVPGPQSVVQPHPVSQSSDGVSASQKGPNLLPSATGSLTAAASVPAAAVPQPSTDELQVLFTFD